MFNSLHCTHMPWNQWLSVTILVSCWKDKILMWKCVTQYKESWNHGSDPDGACLSYLPSCSMPRREKVWHCYKRGRDIHQLQQAQADNKASVEQLEEFKELAWSSHEACKKRHTAHKGKCSVVCELPLWQHKYVICEPFDWLRTRSSVLFPQPVRILATPLLSQASH